MSYLFGKFGMSNLGNTSGTSGTVNRGIVFAGGNNVTLSQSVNASSATLTISAAAQSVQTQNLHNVTLSGNTAGVMAQVSSGTLTLAGGNNVTLSQNGNAVTVSAASQTVQTQNLHNVSLSGNTAGVMAHISSGTLTLAGGNNITLSQNGNAVSIIGGAGGGGGGGIALANSQTTYTSGTANLNVAGGAMTIASTTGQSFNFSVPQTSSLSATGAVSISTNGSTISIGAPAGVTYSYFNPQDAYIQITGQQGQGSLHFQPSQIPNVSFDRVVMPFVFTGASNSTASVSMSVSMGIYTRDASTLSLATSYSATGALTHSGNVNSSLNNGLKLFTMGATSMLPEGQYYIGIVSRTTSAGGNASISQILASQQNSNLLGFWGQANSASIQYTRGLGVYGTTTTAMPTSVAFSQINGTASIVLRQPIFYFVNGTV